MVMDSNPGANNILLPLIIFGNVIFLLVLKVILLSYYYWVLDNVPCVAAISLILLEKLDA